MQRHRKVGVNMDTIIVCLCEKCIRRNEADIVRIGNYTEVANKCYYCDETEVSLRKCEVEL